MRYAQTVRDMMPTDNPIVYVSPEDWGTCRICKKYDDRRFRVCFDCATKAEEKAVAKGRMIREVTD